MNTITNSLEIANIEAQQLDQVFLQGILEGFIDGILILSTKGKILHANESARLLLDQLTPDSKPSNLVPKQIWRICQALKYSFKSYHSQAVIIDSHLTTSQSTPQKTAPPSQEEVVPETGARTRQRRTRP